MKARLCWRTCCPHNVKRRCRRSGASKGVALALIHFGALAAVAVRRLPERLAARAVWGALRQLQRALRGSGAEALIETAERDHETRWGSELTDLCEGIEEPPAGALYVLGETGEEP